MKYFFIDTENVQQYDFLDNFKINNDDKIVMFISERSKKLSVEDLKRFTECNANIIYENVYTGENNALDFQLIANISLTIGIEDSKDIEYYIVSNDNDFIMPTQYLIDRTGVNLQILKPNTNELAITTESLNKEDYSKINLDRRVLDIIENSENLSQLHNNLRSSLGDEKGRNLYKELKSIFKR